LSGWGAKSESEVLNVLEQYPDILTTDHLIEILKVKSKKTAIKWLKENSVFYFRVGHGYKIPKSGLQDFFSASSCQECGYTERQPGDL
jgi:predicted Zn-ribbon and HTH transcriptional regulator